MPHENPTFPDTSFLEPTGLTQLERLGVLPDVALEQLAPSGGQLDRVGMSGIQAMVRVPDDNNGEYRLPARIDAFVSLSKPHIKGIHMSRLYVEADHKLDANPLTAHSLSDILQGFLSSHESMSDAAFVSVGFLLPVRRKSLLSDRSGWRHYPICVAAYSNGHQTRTHLTVDVEYSSACPCSAALSRQFLAEQFQKDFAYHRWITVSQAADWLEQNGTLAVPHSQRSLAEITVRLDEDVNSLPLLTLIDQCELALMTAVQTAVKREDEQEFARRNGENLMFCEDAARRLKQSLSARPDYTDFLIKVRHLESLHAHDAVACVAKGVEGGLTA